MLVDDGLNVTPYLILLIDDDTDVLTLEKIFLTRQALMLKRPEITYHMNSPTLGWLPNKIPLKLEDFQLVTRGK